MLRAIGDVAPFFALIAGTLGGLYFGVVTTTEAAVIGCFLSILLGFVFGELTAAKLIEAMHSTVKFSGNILFLIFAAYIFSYAISFAGIGEKLTEFIVGMQLSKLQFYLVLFVLFTVLGCLIESLGMIVITVPLLYPILGRYGIDPILFGVILVIYIELGQISPPIGINLFVIQSIWDGKLSGGGVRHDPVPPDHVRGAGDGDRVAGAGALAAAADEREVDSVLILRCGRSASARRMATTRSRCTPSLRGARFALAPQDEVAMRATPSPPPAPPARGTSPADPPAIRASRRGRRTP